MESVRNNGEFSSLKENRIVGNPNLTNSTVHFSGKNNILVCEDNINLVNSSIRFEGSNSVVYLCHTRYDYSLDLYVFQNSLVYIGRDNALASNIHINVQEHQNLIIGDDCIIGSNLNVRTSDAYTIFDSNTKRRVNHSASVLIGDHVWLAHQVYIEMGVCIGSGAILNNNAHAFKNSKLKSNTLYSGNPAKAVREDVFFTKDYTGNFKEEDSLNMADYSSRVFLFSETQGETLDFRKIDQMISRFSPDEKLDFIEKLFMRNKSHNRFAI